uniref:COMM domain-containing protein 3 n=1 Tax=Romanomermis culicivorax TaxID=13658 RepID=A0A915I5Y6_ROMCU
MTAETPLFSGQLIEKLRQYLDSDAFSEAEKMRALERCESIFNKDVSDEASFVEVQNVVSSILIECSKENLDEIVLLSFLKTNNIPEQFADVLRNTYEASRASIRKTLNLVGYQAPKIVGTAWKMNFEFQTSLENGVDLPKFVISADVEGGDEHFSNFRFICNAEQMQDIAWKLKEASKCVDKLMTYM